MVTRSSMACRQDAMCRKPGPCCTRPLIVQPLRPRSLNGIKVNCNAAAMGQTASTDENRTHEQQSHQQQPRWASTSPATRKQLNRPVYCVATEPPASAGATTATTSRQDNSSSTTALLDSLHLNISSRQIEQQASSIVIDVDEGSEQASSESSSSVPVVRVKAASTYVELAAVAELRAEAYYADDHSRFAQSFKRQFAAQEVESLRQRTAASSSSGRAQLCECLVAVDAENKRSVLGCIDIRLPQTTTGMSCIGVPEGDTSGCYLLNVVVSEPHRGCGIGKQLMRAAMARAAHRWGAQRLYTHVEADNEVASGLYKSCGFKEHSSEAKYANAHNLGRLVLLMAEAADAPTLEETLWQCGA